MNDEAPHEVPPSNPDTRYTKFITIRVRRRSLAEWLAWLIWLLALVLILEYSLASFREYERQAGILAGAIFVGFLVAGIIVEIIKSIEGSSPFLNAEDDSDNEME